MVLRTQKEDENYGVALFSHTESKLRATLHATGEFEFVTDPSVLAPGAGPRHYEFMGFLTVKWCDGIYLFGFPESTPGRVG